MSLTTGTTAPNFSLFDTDKNQVHLADQKGKNVVLLFFPFLLIFFLVLKFTFDSKVKKSIALLESYFK